ncbi:MAG: TadE family protein [Bryobacteraceae bacterium]|nr:TadE family protein [Bryobacteraceae bacterium]
MRRNRQSGRAILETALVLGAFMTMLIALIDVAQYLFVHASLAERVRAAARLGAESSPVNPALIRTWVSSAGFHLTPDNVQVVELGAGTEDRRLEVRIVNYEYTTISPAMAGFRKAKPIVASVPLGVNH